MFWDCKCLNRVYFEALMLGKEFVSNVMKLGISKGDTIMPKTSKLCITH